MITDALILLIYGVVLAVTAPFRLTPIVSLPSNFTDSITASSGKIMGLDTILPVHEIVFIFVGFFIVYEVAYFGLKLINWVIRKIPGIS